MDKRLLRIFINAALIVVAGVCLEILWRAVEYHHVHSDCTGGDCEWFWCPNRTR